MHNVGDQVVPDGLRDRPLSGIRFHVRRHIEVPSIKRNDCRVSLRDELVLRESLDVEYQVWREGVQQAVAFALGVVLLRRLAVVLGQDGGQGHLRDDVPFEFVLEEWRRGEVEREEEEAHNVHLYLCCLFEAQPVGGVCAGGDGLRLDLEPALECALDHGAARFGFTAAQSEVEVVQEPGEELDGVGLCGESEALVGAEGDFLEELMRRDVGFEGARVPDLAEEDAASLDQLCSLGEVLEKEVVS